jgi:hypothetical protein
MLRARQPPRRSIVLAGRPAEPLIEPAGRNVHRPARLGRPYVSMANNKGVPLRVPCKVAERFFLKYRARGNPAQLSLKPLDLRS